jgi:hypothetical protein
MRAIAVTLTVAALVLPGAGAHAQPLPERIIQPPPAPGMPPRSGTYVDPSASKSQLDFTVQPQRPPKTRKSRKRR